MKLKVDKKQFDNVLGKLIKAQPQKRSETKPDKKSSTKRKPSR